MADDSDTVNNPPGAKSASRNSAGTLETIAAIGRDARLALAVRPWPAGSPVKSAFIGNLTPVVAALLEKFGPLPGDRDSLIVVKPNIHKDMNALMGNTTDLRILAALIACLQDLGYRNVVIAEGANCGVFRFGIDAFQRVGLSALARKFAIPLIDLNTDTHVHFTTMRGDRVRVSKTMVGADFIINVPKLKTHHLTGLSICLKNLMGVVTGMDKRIMHNALAENIMSLNRFIRPDIHLVDGLVAMEGQGPGLGEPLRLDILVAGRVSAVVDVLCSRLAGFDPAGLPLTRLALKSGLITGDEMADLSLFEPIHVFVPSRYTWRNRIVDMKVLIWLRNLTRSIFDNEFMSWLLFLSGIREDEFFRETGTARPRHIPEKCIRCGRCREFCPLGKKDFADSECLGCGYCFWVCPNGGTKFSGVLGYIEKYMGRMLDKTRKL